MHAALRARDWGYSNFESMIRFDPNSGESEMSSHAVRLYWLVNIQISVFVITQDPGPRYKMIQVDQGSMISKATNQFVCKMFVSRIWKNLPVTNYSSWSFKLSSKIGYSDLHDFVTEGDSSQSPACVVMKTRAPCGAVQEVVVFGVVRSNTFVFAPRLARGGWVLDCSWNLRNLRLA